MKDERGYAVGLFKKKEVKNEAEQSVVLEASPDLFNAILSGETITKEQALSIPAVASAVDTIAGKISIIPLKLYQETADKDGRKLVKEVQDKRCGLINDDTGDTLDGVQFKRAIVTDYLLDKGGYAFLNKIGNATKSIHYVKSEKVSISSNFDNEPIFKSYEINVNNRNYKDYQFIKLLRGTKNGANGESVRIEISKALQTAYQNLLMLYASAKKGGKKRGFLSTEKALSKEVLADLQEKWASLYSNDGINSIVLPNGVKMQESTDSTFETNVNTARKQLNDEIKDIFHIGNTEAETFQGAILPILTAFECAINRVLLPEKEKKDGLFFAFDTKEMLKGDIKTRFEAYGIAIEKGFMQPNEARYLENWDKLDGLDIINFGLSAVLYDPQTKSYYTPNTGATAGAINSPTGEKTKKESPETGDEGENEE